MKVIWKFPLKVKTTQEIAIPTPFVILRAGTTDNTPVIWVMVTVGNDGLAIGSANWVRIKTFSTGELISDTDLNGYKYVNTYQIRVGNPGYVQTEVYHVYISTDVIKG